MASVTADPGRADALILRDIARSDAGACHLLSQAVAWPHRIEDWEMAIDLGYGIVAMLGDEIVGTAQCWTYGASHATLGMIIVSPRHQGAGIGARLMKLLLDKTSGRSLLLNATIAGLPLYERMGFVPCGGVQQYHGEVVAASMPVLSSEDRIRSAGLADMPELSKLDRQATGLPRANALETLLSAGECVMLERAGVPVGYSILRRFGRGVVIGPVVATNEPDARALIGYWLRQNIGRFVRIDLVEETGLAEWVLGFGLKSAGGVTTMVRGESPAVAGPARLYALINQSLG